MNQRIKKLWLKALRSGKYLQGQSFMRRKGGDNIDRFCCLGVLSNIYAKETKTRWVRDKENPMIFQIKGRSGLLPNEVVKWAGLESGDPYVEHDCLSVYNDTHGADFNSIAELIEEGL